jgi:hypothetical protein
MLLAPSRTTTSAGSVTSSTTSAAPRSGPYGYGAAGLDPPRPVFATTARLLLVLLVLGGCAGKTSKKDLLAFLTPGRTTRAAAILELGQPTGAYEGDRILTYRVQKEGDGYVLVSRATRWSAAHYTLVLVFDEAGILGKHSLVPIRATP